MGRRLLHPAGELSPMLPRLPRRPPRETDPNTCAALLSLFFHGTKVPVPLLAPVALPLPGAEPEPTTRSW